MIHSEQEYAAIKLLAETIHSLIDNLVELDESLSSDNSDILAVSLHMNKFSILAQDGYTFTIESVTSMDETESSWTFTIREPK